MEPLKTYSHLAVKKRIPSAYEIATSKLLYFVERGFEVNVPLSAWYAAHQRGSPLGSTDWEAFADPSRYTYSSYVAKRAQAESFTQGLLDSIGRSIPRPSWIALGERVIAPARYLWHGFQMLAAYVGQMAPSGRITLAAAFQAADEMRRIQAIARWMSGVRAQVPSFGEKSQAIWEMDEAWQPVRKITEELLVVRDFGEAFVALNLAVKPSLDRLLLVELAGLAARMDQPLFAELLGSLAADAAWHRAWSEELSSTLIAQRASNREVIARWVEHWGPPAAEAAERLGREIREVT